MVKIIQWIALNGVSVLAGVQVIIKFIKEVLTAIVNVLFPIIPDGKFEEIVLKIREFVNTVDEWVEKGKLALLGIK